MTGNILIQAMVTVLAAVVAALYLPDLGKRHGARTRVNAGLHLLMAAGMAAMVWPFGRQVPPALGAAVFVAAAAVYAYQIVVPERRRSSSGLESHQHRGALLWYHFAMMAAMAWMYAAMGLSMASMQARQHIAMAMPATSMPGMGQPVPRLGDGPAGTMARSISGWPAAASWACLLLSVVALVVFAGLLLRSLTPRVSGKSGSERRRTAASVCMAAVMLLGFGLLVLP
ncbi:DUF5134 domain-containing protein [Sinomonas terrae]|uniref:DUF5134 domain-containing protein n=1 Tax=Sinomonas terrae TaxID=2908838 RepID=A0ABS9U4R2_9MICC|nr:DUF5134 domain-containing protein [Sinomonas terrae]MCH6471566.1 DUF5134 domain-containing protein [Sinomonas terrae]